MGRDRLAKAPAGPAAGSGGRRGARERERQALRRELPIGERLRYMRRQRALTQEQVAAMLGLNRTAYTHYENGVNMPDILTLVRLAEAYALSPGELDHYNSLGQQTDRTN